MNLNGTWTWASLDSARTPDMAFGRKEKAARIREVIGMYILNGVPKNRESEICLISHVVPVRLKVPV